MMLGEISTLMPRLHCKRNIPCIVKRRLIQKLREIHRRANRRNEEILATYTPRSLPCFSIEGNDYLQVYALISGCIPH